MIKVGNSTSSNKTLALCLGSLSKFVYTYMWQNLGRIYREWYVGSETDSLAGLITSQEDKQSILALKNSFLITKKINPLLKYFYSLCNKTQQRQQETIQWVCTRHTTQQQQQHQQQQQRATAAATTTIRRILFHADFGGQNIFT